MIIFDCILISYLHYSLNFPYKGFLAYWDRRLHSIKTKLSANVFALDKIKYSCFCHIWIGKTKSNDVCEKKMYVKDWKHTELNTKGKMYVEIGRASCRERVSSPV